MGFSTIILKQKRKENINTDSNNGQWFQKSFESLQKSYEAVYKYKKTQLEALSGMCDNQGQVVVVGRILPKIEQE